MAECNDSTVVIKNSITDIPPDDPFKNDRLGRKESAEILTQLIKSVKEPFVLALDAAWGRGKSTFIHMWQAELTRRGYNTLYFNAWENDFIDDPLIALIGEIQFTLNAKSTKARKSLELAKKAAGRLCRTAVPTIAKLATYGLLDFEDLSEKAIGDAVSKSVTDGIENYKKDKASLETFRNNLEQYIGLSVKDKDDKSIVFFIDELDRCRPTYAVEVLERIKHLFSISGIVFVIALDKEQLEYSVKTLYGVEMNASGYLSRFFDLEYQLPIPSLEKFADFLFVRFGLSDVFAQRSRYFTNADFNHNKTILTDLFPALSLSIRDVEKYMSRLNIIYRITPVSHDLFPLLLGALIAIRIRDYKIYNQIINGDINSLDVMSYIGKSKEGRIFSKSKYGIRLRISLGLSGLTNAELSQAINSKQPPTYGSSDEERIEGAMLSQFISAASSPVIQYLHHKIEIGDRFQEIN